VAQTEIFGPVLVVMTVPHAERGGGAGEQHAVRARGERVDENINLALDVAPQLKAGVVWVNATNLFDAAAGFGGYRESGFGREGGREGMWEYVRAAGRADGWSGAGGAAGRPPDAAAAGGADVAGRGRRRDVTAGGDVTATTRRRRAVRAAADRPHRQAVRRRQAGAAGLRLHAGGASARTGACWARSARGTARTCATRSRRRTRRPGWARQTGHARAQVLYYVAENLAARGGGVRGAAGRDDGRGDGAAEVEASVARLFTYAAWADKYDGAVHNVPIRGVALAMHEAIGVVGVACPGRAAAARPRLAGRAARRDGQHGRRRAERAAPARRDRLLLGARHERRAGRRGEHRDRREGRARARARRARRRRRGLVRGTRRARGRWSSRRPAT
jgi:aldehyde dehydrogenase (NAD+)